MTDKQEETIAAMESNGCKVQTLTTPDPGGGVYLEVKPEREPVRIMLLTPNGVPRRVRK